MSFSYKFYFNFTRGPGYYNDINGKGYLIADEILADNNYIVTSSVERVMRFHKDLEPNSNTLKFQMRRDSMLGANTITEWLLKADDDIHIRVTRSSDGVNYSPYFRGFLSDNYKIKVNHDGVELIDFQAEDYTNKIMKRKWASINPGLYKSHYISNTGSSGNASKSLVSKVCSGPVSNIVPLRYAANGYTLLDVPNITNSLPAYYLPSDSESTCYDMLKSLLFEYGYTFFFDESGYLVVKSFRIPTDTSPTTGFFNTASSRNIIGKIEVIKNQRKNKYVKVKLSTVATKTNQIIFSDTSGGDSINKCNIVIKAGKAYPDGSETNTSSDQNTYSEYKLESGEEIIAVDGTTLDVLKDSQISIVRQQNLNTKMNLKLINDGASDYSIRKLDIIGSTVYCKDQMIVESYGKNAWNETEGENTFEYEAKYISTSAEGMYLAKTLGDYYKYANLLYTIKSKDVFQVGDIVKIEEDIVSGINTVAQIIEKKDCADSDIITYTCVGISEITVEATIKEEFLNTPTPAASNTVNKQEVNQIVKAVERKQSFYNTKTSVIVPLDIYPTGGAAQEDYTTLIEMAAQYPNVNFFVVLKSAADNADYEDAIKKMRDAGISILVYLNTNFKNISLETAKTNINSIVTANPNIDGLFIDRIPVESSLSLETKSYYTNLRDHAILCGLFPIILNVEEKVPQEYYTTSLADIFVIGTREEYPLESELMDYIGSTNADLYNKAIMIRNRPFDAVKTRMMLDYCKIFYHHQADYANPTLATASFEQKSQARFGLTVVPKLKKDHLASTIYSHADMKFDLTVIPSKMGFWKTLSDSLDEQCALMSGSLSWQDVIDAASAATPRTPEIISASFAGSAELSWEYQTDLGPALKYYEILISKDHDPDNSDPDNGTWWKPKNDGTNWRYDDDTDPLQLTTESYSFVAPLDLDTDDMPVESVYFFKVRRVSAKSNSGWGYASAALRPISTVEIGKDTISAPMIRAGSITADKIATASITASHIASVDGGAIKTGNIQSETYQQGSAGWKLAMSGSAEFNDVTVRGTVYATSGVFSGSINSGPLMLNLNPPSTTSTTITSGGNVVDWIRALQSSASIVAGSYNCSGTYNSTALGRLELAQTTESPAYEYWQKTGTHNETGQVWTITGYTDFTSWVDQWGIPHFSGGQPIYGWVSTSTTVEDDVKWTRTTTKYTYVLKLYSSSNTLLCTYTDWYETAGSWINSGVTSTNLNASTSAPSTPSATQGTVSFSASGSVSFSATAYTYKLMNLPTADTGLPVGTVYQDANGFLKIKI